MVEPDRGLSVIIPHVVHDIYAGKLDPGERQKLGEMRAFYEGSGDSQVFDEIQRLRAEVGTLEGWKAAKERTRQELAATPDDILEQLLERFAPFIKNLPPGSSRGHFMRDGVYLTAIFQDPDIQSADAVEVFVGMLAGMYHDIGTSVAERYHEAKRFSAHAEVGAHLFGEISKSLLGENLIKLTQYAIVAHTHYRGDRTVTKDGETSVVFLN